MIVSPSYDLFMYHLAHIISGLLRCSSYKHVEVRHWQVGDAATIIYADDFVSIHPFHDPFALF